MDQKIKIIDYRNGRFQGFLNEERYQGLGATLDDDFGFSLSYWKNGSINGPCLFIFPDEKLFYGQFSNNRAQGVCCYDMGDECQIYAQFDNDGYLTGLLAAVFPSMQLILSVASYSSDSMKTAIENSYQNQDEKWRIVNDILNSQLEPEMKNLRKFLVSNFLINNEHILEQIRGSDYFFGFKGAGLGFKMTPDRRIKALGIFDETNLLDGMGKRNLISNNAKVIEEGMFPYKVVEYPSEKQRPNYTKKIIHDYFRQSLAFTNKFLSIGPFKEIQHLFNILNLRITDSKTEKIAQEMLENPKEYIIEKIIPKQVQKSPEQVMIGRIKEEIQRSKSKKKDYAKSDRYRNFEEGNSFTTFTQNKRERININRNPENQYSPIEMKKNIKNQEKFPSRIYANLKRKYDSPIRKLDEQKEDPQAFYKSTKSPVKYKEMEKKIADLQKKRDQNQKYTRGYKRKYVYNDTNEIYRSTKPQTNYQGAVDNRKSPSPFAPQRRKRKYF